MIKHATRDGFPGFKWGNDGFTFIYDPGSPESKENARMKALRTSQSAAVSIGYHSMQHFAAADIEAMVPQALHAEILTRDSHPKYAAYAIAHTGKATGTMVNVGPVTVKYFKEIITKIHNILKIGTKFFHNHGETNDHANRMPVGELVAKKLENIKGVMHNVVIAYIYPDSREKKLDVASMETDLVLESDGNGRMSAMDVQDITGIALGDSDVDEPGFPGARLLAAIQNFASDGKNGGSVMTLEELQAVIKTGGFAPSDLFKEDALLKDPTVKSKIDITGTSSARRIRVEELKPVEDELAKLKIDHADLTTTMTTLKAEKVRGSARGVLDAIVLDRKANDVQKKFIDKEFKNFTTEAGDEETLKSDVTKFVDAQIENVKSMREMFGIKEESPDLGTPPGDSDNGGEGSEDLSDPKNNPMIPT